MTKRSNSAATTDPNWTLKVEAATEGERAAAIAQAVLRPSVQGAATIQKFKPVNSDVELGALINELRSHADLVSTGNLSRVEGMLIIQAHTLDAIFNNLARRASGCEYLSQFEAYLRLGLKAQSQSRATLETLAAIKNPPPVTFVQQANVAHGPQQVNNGVQQNASRARETENPPNKLLEQQHGERLDGGTAQATVGTNPPMEAVGALNRTADTGRQSPDGPQSLQGRQEAGTP